MKGSLHVVLVLGRRNHIFVVSEWLCFFCVRAKTVGTVLKVLMACS